MAKNFKIPIPSKSTPKTVRFPDELIQKVEYVIQGTEATFSSFVVEATRVALENLEEEEKS